MQRPSWRDRLLGHRTAVWATTGALGLSALAALGHGCSWLVPVGALLVRSASASARQRVTVWREWTEA
jgi:hypothetical protein